MGKIAFDAIPADGGNGGSRGTFDFFNLRNDGDEAIVRIMHDNVESFNIYAVHNITVGGKYRKINCIRNPQDAVEMCPLCNTGNNISTRIFINMIQYNLDPQTQTMVGTPVVWERSTSYATKLRNLIDEYGPLSESLFKIKRNGAAGSMDTTYDIFYCSPKVYTDASYPPVQDAFSDYDALGSIILNKNYQEIVSFVQTGTFPGTQQPASEQPAPASMGYQPKAETATVDMPPVAPASTPVPNVPPAPVYQQPSVAPPFDVAPTQTAPVAPTYPTPPTGAPGWQPPQTTGGPAKPGPRYY